MPKMKTHKASNRRLRITKNGKIVRRQCGVRHMMTNRSPKLKRQHRCNATTTTTGIVKKFKAYHVGD